MASTSTDVLTLVFTRLREVQANLGIEPVTLDDPELLLADLLDSMALVELVAVLAHDRGVTVEAIENAAGHHFSTIARLVAAVENATAPLAHFTPASPLPAAVGSCWLSSPCSYLPRRIEPAHELDVRLGRPPGWFASHTGIRQRHVWDDEDAIDAAARVAVTSLESAGLLIEEVGGLLVTSQAPPQLAGLAATLHQRLNLMPRAVALEVGGACTGFLQALWLARSLVEQLDTILIVAVEAPSRHLVVEPGESGEAAALFGDGVACCLVTRTATMATSLPLIDIGLSVSEGGDLLRVVGDGRTGIRIQMDGPQLAARTVESLAELVRETAEQHRLNASELSAVIVHGGNGRLPALLARRLELPVEKVWSQTSETGNLGSASLPMAWSKGGAINGPVVWAAIGAGLTLGSALTMSTLPG